MKRNNFQIPTDIARVIDRNISELILYTRKSEKEVLDLLKNSMINRNMEWAELSQESVLNFHRLNEYSLYCLVKWNSEEKYQEIISYNTYICRQKNQNKSPKNDNLSIFNTNKILDFGGGIGELSINLAANNLNVDFIEVPGNTLTFAKWRFKRRYLDINIFTSLNQVTAYDTIICLDVIETLEKPLAHLTKFYQLLNKEGLLILSQGEVGSPNHPMNLEQNRDFIQNLDTYCKEIGFIDSSYENKYHLKILQKQ